MTTLVAVRHGETDWNRNRRIQGWAPVGLNDRGRTQAQEVADRLTSEYDVDRIVTSDLQRTVETAEIVAAALDVEDVQHEPAFRERHLGVLQGLLHEDAYTHYDDYDGGSLTGLPGCPEGGESLDELAERVRDGLDDLRESMTDGETVVLVSHGGPLRVLLGDASGMDLAEAIDAHSPDNCSHHPFRLSAEGIDPHDGQEIV